jgi:hypothetical protein
MPREEPRDLVHGLAGLVRFPDVELEDARSFWGHLQGHLDAVPDSISGQPDGVVTVVCLRRSNDPQAIISADVANSPGYLLAGRRAPPSHQG